MYGPPVDLSFKDISDITDALAEKPHSGLRPLTTNSENKYLSRSLRLNNNKLSNVAGLQFMLMEFLAEPTKLGWLDLSFNQLTCIDPVFCELNELRIFYLHGNGIVNVKEVDKLGQLKHLHTLTLHGNAIENSEGYRSHVICALPHLKALDFSSVTLGEQNLAKMWSKDVKKPRKDNVSQGI